MKNKLRTAPQQTPLEKKLAKIKHLRQAVKKAVQINDFTGANRIEIRMEALQKEVLSEVQNESN